MKTLYESILSVNNIGIDTLIRTWLEENNVIKDNAYKIKNHIIYPNDDVDVQLFDRDYNELPEYIQFADGYYYLKLGCVASYVSSNPLKEIKSWRGLPKRVTQLTLDFEEKLKFPELKINTGCLNIYSVGMFNKQNKLNITYDKKMDMPDGNTGEELYEFGVYGVVHFNYCDGEDLMDLQNCKFNGFGTLKFGDYSDDVTKIITDIFDYRRYKQLTRQQKLKLEKLLKSIGFDSVKFIKTVNGEWRLHKNHGEWQVIKY